jgi:uncharacterized membrane protein YphA (DoxX/SURF4 family)
MCLRRILSTHAPTAVILVRLLVGGVFLSEGVQKFLYPELGVGRFTKIGIGIQHPESVPPVLGCRWATWASPAILASVVGGFEIGCGGLLILGFLTRLASIPLIVIISVAIATTKAPLLAKSSFWGMAHEARTDYCMFLGGLFLLIVGAGLWSLDAPIAGQEVDDERS